MKSANLVSLHFHCGQWLLFNKLHTHQTARKQHFFGWGWARTSNGLTMSTIVDSKTPSWTFDYFWHTSSTDSLSDISHWQTVVTQSIFFVFFIHSWRSDLDFPGNVQMVKKYKIWQMSGGSKQIIIFVIQNTRALPSGIFPLQTAVWRLGWLEPCRRTPTLQIPLLALCEPREPHPERRNAIDSGASLNWKTQLHNLNFSLTTAPLH